MRFQGLIETVGTSVLSVIFFEIIAEDDYPRSCRREKLKSRKILNGYAKHILVVF